MFLEKIKKKLSSWKVKVLAFAGRVCLIKFVLSSLPLFFLSMVRAPKCICKVITKLQLQFFLRVGSWW